MIRTAEYQAQLDAERAQRAAWIEVFLALPEITLVRDEVLCTRNVEVLRSGDYTVIPSFRTFGYDVLLRDHGTVLWVGDVIDAERRIFAHQRQLAKDAFDASYQA